MFLYDIIIFAIFLLFPAKKNKNKLNHIKYLNRLIFVSAVRIPF